MVLFSMSSVAEEVFSAESARIFLGNGNQARRLSGLIRRDEKPVVLSDKNHFCVAYATICIAVPGLLPAFTSVTIGE